ncbi:MAG TPA: hypothetical protein VFK02_20970 [Kofleriaceae bacterium]|nr:hypothetical protein [Kofleriaceae bacterium]
MPTARRKPRAAERAGARAAGAAGAAGAARAAGAAGAIERIGARAAGAAGTIKRPIGGNVRGFVAGVDVVPRLIAAGPPPEWRVGELTVVIGQARAELRYAKESVGSSRPTPEAVMEAVRRARGRLAARSRGPDELLPALATAYGEVLARHGARAGERVPLVEVLGALEGYTRAQFAWDMARLRRERRLVVGGRRIDLGVATGHAAGRRSRVVWIENEGGGGSYFQSFRLIAQEVRA